jgi:hypothetical protein
MAVLRDGTIACGYQNGMKLYVYPGPAVRRAGIGGTVFHVRHGADGMVAERISGPALTLQKDESK